jgi:hypothetical protein
MTALFLSKVRVQYCKSIQLKLECGNIYEVAMHGSQQLAGALVSQTDESIDEEALPPVCHPCEPMCAFVFDSNFYTTCPAATIVTRTPQGRSKDMYCHCRRHHPT